MLYRIALKKDHRHRINTNGIPNNKHLTAFPVQEEEEDLPEDFLRLEVNFGEVFEKEQEDSALMDLLGKLCLYASLDYKLSDSKLHYYQIKVSDPIQERGDQKGYNENRRDKKKKWQDAIKIPSGFSETDK